MSKARLTVYDPPVLCKVPLCGARPWARGVCGLHHDRWSGRLNGWEQVDAVIEPSKRPDIGARVVVCSFGFADARGRRSCLTCGVRSSDPFGVDCGRTRDGDLNPSRRRAQ